MYSTNDVTILIPAYCRTKESLGWFEECLESALKQESFINIVSDASPVPVNEVVHDLWDERISYQRLPEHRGVSFARNRAARDTNTALQIPLDCDDTFTDDAVERLVEAFDGTPLYPDVCKFGEEDVPHYQLLEFDCNLVYQKVGLASVNVLHTREQWRKVGGWNEYIDFYEDGEYNARLMISFCGKRYPFPLINYRIHSGQRTKTNKGRAGQQAKNILATIKEHPGMCCGDKARKQSRMLRATSVNPVIRRSEMNLDEVPGTQGDRVLALYVGGKGISKHYYKGPVTKYPYKVAKGNYYYVDPRDAKLEGDPIGRSLFIRVARDVPVESKPEKVERVPREAPKVEKTPVEAEKKESVMFKKKAEETLPDINGLRWAKEIRHMDFSPYQAKELLKIEKAGKERVKVIAHLEKFL